MLKRLLGLAIIGIIGLVFMSPSAYALTTTQIVNVTPSLTELRADPGGSTEGKVDVINIGKSDFKVSLSSSPYHVSEPNYTPEFTALPGTVDPSKWVHFTTTTNSVVAAQKVFTTNYRIDVPKGTAPGGYYAVIFAETSPAEASQSNVVTHGRIGDILYITVNGAVKTKGTATASTIPTVIVSTPLRLGVTVANEGGLHFKSAATTQIKDIFGRTAFTNDMPAYVLPQTQRTFTTAWSPSAAIGIYQINRTALLPEGQVNLPSKWVLVIQPWVIIVLIVIIVLLVIISILSIRHQGRKRREP